MKKASHCIGIVLNKGLGDGLAMIPLANYLRSKGHQMEVIIQSPWGIKEVLDPLSAPFRTWTLVPGQRRAVWQFATRHFRRYDYLLLDRNAASANWLAAAPLLAKQVHTNRMDVWVSYLPAVRKIAPLSGLNNFIEHHFRLWPFDPLPNLADAISKALRYPDLSKTLNPIFPMGLPERAILIQPSAANFKVQWKNWPTTKWVALFQRLRSHYPQTELILLGDQNEVPLSKAIETLSQVPLTNFIGQTSLLQVIALLQRYEWYLGLDSGLMHLAAMMGKSTFSIWGPTCPVSAGYQDLLPNQHFCMQQPMPCQPCWNWPKPNRSRVDHPNYCPDWACIKELPVDSVWKELQAFIEGLPTSQSPS